VETPGLSAAVFGDPLYTCTRNIYVDPNGSSAWDGTAPTHISGTNHGPLPNLLWANDDNGKIPTAGPASISRRAPTTQTVPAFR
jgi:hypothetical protein